MVSLRLLDIIHDPESQGYTWHDYDLIVINGIPDLSQHMDDAVANIFKLLGQNGEIIFLHQRRLPLYYCLIFGTLPGWFPDGELLDDLDSASVLRKRCQEILQDRKSGRTIGRTSTATNDCTAPSVEASDTLQLNTTPLVDSESPLPTEPPTHPQPPSILFDNNQPADKIPSRLSGVKISKGAGQPSNTAATTLITKLATLLAVDEETIDPSATLASVRSGCLLLELVPWRWLDTRNHFVSVMDTMVWSRTQALAEFPGMMRILAEQRNCSTE